MDIGADIISLAGEALELSAEPEKKMPVSCVIEHALLPEHLADYIDQHGQLTSTQKAEEKDIQVLRSKHHEIARLLAEGIPEGVVAQMTNYTAAHISTLKSNPAMVELIAFYRGPKNEAAQMIGSRLRMVAGMSLDLIEQKLEEKGQELTISDLAAVSKLGFDRSGHGPTSTVNNVLEHRIIPSEELIELQREARRRDANRIVEPETVRQALPAPQRETIDATAETRSESPGVADHGDDRDGPDSGP